MAKLNGMYIFVESEDISYGVDVTEHTVENGIAISDHARRRARTLSLTGEIVGSNASSVLSKLRNASDNAKSCKYVGRVSFSNCLITEFSPSTSADIAGGYSFTMTLKEIRSAKTSYKKTKSDTKKSGTQQTKKNSKTTYVYHTVKKGDTIWALVEATNAPYKKYGMTCNEVMKLNPSAFSKAGDFRTLQIGKKIIVGKR